jgi:hypothetical protein
MLIAAATVRHEGALLRVPPEVESGSEFEA